MSDLLPGVKRPATARVVISVVVMVLSVALVLLIYHSVGGGTSRMMRGRLSSVPESSIELMAFSPKESVAEIYLRNSGRVDLDTSGGVTAWQVFINGSAVEILEVEPDAEVLHPGETLKLVVRVAVNPRAPQRIKVFGPGSAQAFMNWQPQG